MRSCLRLSVLAVLATLGLVLLVAASLPARYVARASLLLPKSQGESRVLRLETSATEPTAALAQVRALLARHSEAELLDPPAVLPAQRDLAAWLFLGALAGLAAGFAVMVMRARRWRPVRHERELITALGEPLLAAHPSSTAAVRALCGQLGEHWFVGARRLLPIVEVGSGASAVALAVELANAFAGRGQRTLLIDGDLRSPRLHTHLGVSHQKGLADFLEGRGVQLAMCRENLALLTAGSAREHPLELLSRARLRHLLGAAAQPFRVVLVCTPSAARGPDFEIFAALAGGALVFAGRESDAGELVALRKRLARCAARVVGTVLERA